MEYKEDFKSGSMAAAHGGFTTVLDMPNTKPPTNTLKEFKRKIKLASKKSIVDFGLHAGVNLQEVQKIVKLSPASFKIYMEDTSINTIKKMFDILNSTNIPLTFHCEKREINYERDHRGKSPHFYSDARPTISEEIAVAEAVSFSAHYNHPIHICHLSSKKALKIIKNMRNLAPVTCEVTPHHLFLDSSYFNKFGSFVKTNPPLRSREEGINIKDLNDIDIIATDHAPHTLDEKEKEFWEAPAGIPNLEVSLKLFLTLFAKGKIKLNEIKTMFCEKPATIFGLTNKGFIKEGMDADFVVIDHKKTGKISADEFYSKAQYTPFEGFEYIGEAVMTILRGKVIMEEGEVFKNKGKYVRSEYRLPPTELPTS